ncbi:MAG: hypothetical protein R3320_06565 [Nitriliruptorales bacterium]|nr:hypothetical protein [Nitriliruptorales bacterium]
MAVSIPTSSETGAQTAASKTAPAMFMVDPVFLSMFPTPRPPIPVLICRYNPKTLKLSGGTEWKQAEANQQRELKREQFQARKPRTLSVTLFFDQFELPSGDLEPELKALWDWTEPRQDFFGHKSAPWLRFQWGAKNYFRCYIESLSVTYTLFSRSGAPLRATADVTLKETVDLFGGTNPTSGGPGGERSHTISAGESLHTVAHRYYGDPRMWRGLAAFNDIDDPLRLPTGARVSIPEPKVVEELS